eukprot:4491622-Alexandrium_andersonii.AAC.1
MGVSSPAVEPTIGEIRGLPAVVSVDSSEPTADAMLDQDTPEPPATGRVTAEQLLTPEGHEELRTSGSPAPVVCSAVVPSEVAAVLAPEGLGGRRVIRLCF